MRNSKANLPRESIPNKGIVMFAYNSDFDYVKIANVCAALANKWTSLPVTLITDEFGALQAGKHIDNIIIQPSNGTNKRTLRTTHDAETQVIDWKNLNRASVYDLSPYDQTILIDCDYLIFSDTLYELTWTDVEFTCHKDVYDVTGQNCFQSDQRLNQYSIPMLWATVIYFTKCSFSKSVFDMMKHVQANYEYYAKVYGFKVSPFRNDFALSIAYHAMSGYGLDELIPWKLNTLSPMTDVVDFRPNDGQLLYQYKQKGKLYTGMSERVNLHVMNKAIFTDEIIEKMLKYAEK